MQKEIFFASMILGIILVACGTPVPTPTPPENSAATVVAPSGYRPLQAGDSVEGVTIGYQYVLPSLEQPVVVIAASPYLLHFMNIKPELKDGLVAYIRELPQGKSVLAFDENDPKQKEPKAMTWDARKPVEIAFIPLPEAALAWSVTEEDGGEIQTAYKIIRRKDGGLRFIDAYGKNALYSASSLGTNNGTGIGLMFSARLALLRMIFTDPRYQQGANVMANFPPDYGQYDPRILKLDPTKEGLQINRDWVLVTIPGPNPGMVAP